MTEMTGRFNRLIYPLVIALMVGMASAATTEAFAVDKKGKAKTTATAKTGKSGNASGTGVKSGKKGSSKGTTAKKGKKGGKQKAGAAKVETSAEVKKRQEAAQREIKLTKEQIAQNEKDVRKGLNELGKLQSDIDVTKVQVSTAASEVASLDKKITTLTAEVAKNEKEVERLRSEYLKAVKKMRLKRKTNSTLAFIFSSKNFNQAMRRKRYLRQFSQWKDRKSDEINGKVQALKRQTELLAQTKADKDAVYRRQLAAQKNLENQYVEQDALVVELKKNGDALRSHLANKQQEANALLNRIASLIAAEQQKAEADRRRKEEAARAAEAQEKQKTEDARKREEMRQREERELKEQQRRNEEQKRLLAEAEAREKKAQEEASKEKAREEKRKAEEARKEAKRLEKENADAKKKLEADRKKEKERQEEKNRNYAEARKRKPRGSSADNKTEKPNGNTAAVAPSPSGATFEKMRGALPRPVAGAFKVTSRFGRHGLPDLPDVMYDNPGIDAEVAAGSSAQAVFGGKVSGVYVIPGFSTVVIVNHGNYYTVYGNIALPSVKVGDSVKQGQALGRLAAVEDDASHSSIHFEVWRNREKLNPLEWIRP